MGITHDKQATWKRRSFAFSCGDSTWSDAKHAWGRSSARYPAWTDWLEAAIAEKADRRHDELGATHLAAAPERLPTGRRQPRDGTAEPRTRRAFRCSPDIWKRARAAWWSQEHDYPALSDWLEEALEEKARPRRTRTAR